MACGPTSAILVKTKDHFRIVRCERCSLIFVDSWNTIRDLEKLYGPPYFLSNSGTPLGYRDYLSDRDLHLKNSHALLAILERTVPGARRRILDVGCAHGFFLVAARERGWIPLGVDISAEAIEYARDRLGLTVFQGDLDTHELTAETFDAVAMVGTIEHMPDPLNTLQSAAALLKGDGILLITTLDIEGLLGYFEWKPPEHLFYFSFRTLSNLLDKAGFRVQSRRLYWTWYRVSDVAARLWAYWGLPGSTPFVTVLNRLGIGRLSLKIPTNEILVLAQKR